MTDFPTHHIKARATHAPAPALRDALNVLTRAQEAREGDLVLTMQSFRVGTEREAIPEPRDTELWRLTEGRLLPVTLGALDPETRARAALPYALTAELAGTLGVVMTAIQDMVFDKAIQLRLALFPGGAVVTRWISELALDDRGGEVAQAHVDTHFRAFVDGSLSNHARIAAIGDLEWVLSDLATWGAFERHLGTSDGALPHRHRIRVSL